MDLTGKCTEFVNVKFPDYFENDTDISMSIPYIHNMCLKHLANGPERFSIFHLVFFIANRCF